jgi:uncharacterized protein YbaA (DUF1428 family)
MPYIDGFVVPVPKKNLAKYKAMGRRMGRIWRDHGALSYTETMADDVKPGKTTSFPQAVKLKPGEVVWLSFAKFRNRRHRDRVNKNAMNDPRVAKLMANPKDMPFDMRRIFFGGFKVVIDL